MVSLVESGRSRRRGEWRSETPPGENAERNEGDERYALRDGKRRLALRRRKSVQQADLLEGLSDRDKDIQIQFLIGRTGFPLPPFGLDPPRIAAAEFLVRTPRRAE